MMQGRRINERYELIRPLGGGGMADVYLAQDLILDRYTALKMLKEQFAEDDEFIRRFHREAESSASLSHEHIVPIYDVGEDGSTYYMVMEYVEGQTLKEYIRSAGPLTPEETVRILSQMTAALDHAHRHRIIHRDVKPQNILIGLDGTAKVADFGIARAISEATITHTNSILGSVHYLSPEQARGGRITYRSDLYSLGVIAFEMLQGEVPFQGDTAVSVALKHLQETLPPLERSDIPQPLNNVITKLTAKNPDDRYASASALLADLDTVLDPSRAGEAPLDLQEDLEATKAVPAADLQQGAAEEETKVPAAAPDKKKTSRKRFFWAAGILVLLALLAVLIVPAAMQVDEVTIPDLTDEPADQAEAELSDMDLTVERTYREDDEIMNDHVIGTDPQAGTTVREGSSITMIVSSYDPSVDMPDLEGMDLQAAEEVLEEFSDVSLSYEETTEHPDDRILEQTPAAGETIIPAETGVELVVSERYVYTMANLLGMTRGEVLDLMQEEPYMTVSFSEAYSTTGEEGTVIDQDPPRGTDIEESSTVEVVLSRGPEPEPEDAEAPLQPDPGGEEEVPENTEEEEQESVTASVPFEVEVPEADEDVSYDIEFYLTDSENDDVLVESATISSSTQFDIEITLDPEEEAELQFIVNDEEFEESPYTYTYQQLLQYEE
ncbi:Stk1 family PASTA domain-containing Ser/Thr kinase [Alkalicoccus chagannorensis]|uniref:Stk1 family PASTA domain-containing Ser/Thr kinase n=1 Tax=Alkalicoccus chagannorensis TaxID=427072 RepID=UPI00040B57D1|nr:Stk1 family PASTA domain-containing Ser/Thr kinase [Alkalicoccus chagannorensis]